MISKPDKIGIFDSGLGGLAILQSIRKTLPKYDYVYYGDTKNLPYGNKSQQEIFQLTVKGIKYLINSGCSLIIIACNTASAKALRKIQQEWLPKHAPKIKVLGVIVPTIETLAKKDFPAGIIATTSTVKSKIYQKELEKLFSEEKLIAKSAPQLATLIEKQDFQLAETNANQIIKPLAGKVKSLILGCTHYSLIAKSLQKQWPRLRMIDQTKIIPQSLKKYLSNHLEIKNALSQNKAVTIYFTKETAKHKKLAQNWFK